MGDERVEQQDEVKPAEPEQETVPEPRSAPDTDPTPDTNAPDTNASDTNAPDTNASDTNASDSVAAADPAPGADPAVEPGSMTGRGPDAEPHPSGTRGPHPESSSHLDFGPIPELDLDDEPGETRRRLLSMVPRLGAMVAFGCAGFLGITSFVTAQGTDLRAERQSDLSDLVQAQAQRANELSHRVAELDQEVAELSQRVGGVEVEHLEKATEKLRPEVGLTPVSGPGLAVSLDDAPREMRDGQPNLDALVVHQQDIQAVVNAMWAGGAEAVTIQGQRLISTSAIRCVGNSVVLHGVPYPPPYRISAVGDVPDMVKSMYASDEVKAYLDAVDRFKLGFELQRHPELRLPGFEGSFELSHADVIGAGATGQETADR